ncbi:MAG: DUF2339 domain-containing protein [Dehalococcoidia bacterium]
MICPACGHSEAPGNTFCTQCGQRLPTVEPPPQSGEVSSAENSPEASDLPTDASLEGQVRSLQTVVDNLRSELSRHSDRLVLLERLISAPGTEPPRSQSSAPGPATAAVSPAAPAIPPRAPQPPPSEAGGPPPGRRPLFGGDINWNWEWLVGGNWLARIGIVALVIGVGFFLKLAFDNDWIGETGRVALGIVGGLALLGAGEYWRRKYPIWSQPLTGGGIAILYLAIFAGFSFYDLIHPLIAFGLFLLITLTAAGLALRYESIAIAILGIIGGFATPVLLNERLPDQRLLLSYVLVLDLGVLALATFRNWRWFTLLALGGSLFLYWFWLTELEPGLLLSQLGITFIFLIFVGATTLFHIIWRRVAGPFDQALMVVNAAAYFGISYALMFDEFRPWMGGFTLLLALLYALVGYVAVRRSQEQVNLSLFAVGIGIVFITIAVPVQLGGPWISVAWAAEGAVLIWLASYLNMPQLRWGGYAVFGIFTVWLLVIDTPAGFRETFRTDFSPFLNVYLPAYVFSAGLTFFTAYLLRRERDTLLPWEQYAFSAFLVAGNLFATISVITQVEGAWIAIAWSVEAIIILWLSFRLGLVELKLFGLGLLSLVTARLLIFDTFNVELLTFRPVVNLRFLAFAVGIAAMYLAVYMFWWWREREVQPWEDELARYYRPGLLAVGSLLTLWLLSAEIITTVQSPLFNLSRQVEEDVISLSLSILWAVYAAALIVVGVVRRDRWIRLAGLGLLAIPVAKLFVFDVFALDQEYRVAAFLGLGALLVAGGFLYQRYSSAIRGFLFE